MLDHRSVLVLGGVVIGVSALLQARVGEVTGRVVTLALLHAKLRRQLHLLRREATQCLWTISFLNIEDRPRNYNLA